MQGYNNPAARLCVLTTNLLAQAHEYMLRRPNFCRLNFGESTPIRQYFATHGIKMFWHGSMFVLILVFL